MDFEQEKRSLAVMSEKNKTKGDGVQVFLSFLRKRMTYPMHTHENVARWWI